MAKFSEYYYTFLESELLAPTLEWVSCEIRSHIQRGNGHELEITSKVPSKWKLAMRTYNFSENHYFHSLYQTQRSHRSDFLEIINRSCRMTCCKLTKLNYDEGVGLLQRWGNGMGYRPYHWGLFLDFLPTLLLVYSGMGGAYGIAWKPFELP